LSQDDEISVANVSEKGAKQSRAIQITRENNNNNNNGSQDIASARLVVVVIANAIPMC
jgi:hypothetical protein